MTRGGASAASPPHRARGAVGAVPRPRMRSSVAPPGPAMPWLAQPLRVVPMARQVYDYDPPDRFVAGTVGQPGSRTFFFQARTGSRLTSVALEKTQVTILAERVDE